MQILFSSMESPHHSKWIVPNQASYQKRSTTIRRSGASRHPSSWRVGLETQPPDVTGFNHAPNRKTYTPKLRNWFAQRRQPLKPAAANGFNKQNGLHVFVVFLCFFCDCCPNLVPRTCFCWSKLETILLELLQTQEKKQEDNSTNTTAQTRWRWGCPSPPCSSSPEPVSKSDRQLLSPLSPKKASAAACKVRTSAGSLGFSPFQDSRNRQASRHPFARLVTYRGLSSLGLRRRKSHASFVATRSHANKWPCDVSLRARTFNSTSAPTTRSSHPAVLTNQTSSSLPWPRPTLSPRATSLRVPPGLRMKDRQRAIAAKRLRKFHLCASCQSQLRRVPRQPHFVQMFHSRKSSHSASACFPSEFISQPKKYLEVFVLARKCITP